jgi:hypothetical protein
VRRLLVIGAAVAVLAVAAAASAKEGVEATLVGSIPRDAPSGSVVRVEWRLAEVNTRRPFEAGGIFVRLTGRHGAVRTAPARALGSGRFAASVAVPAGGIGRLAIGLHGWSSGPNGTRKSDLFFRIVNDPFAGVWAPLRRPLRVPTLGPGRTCPVSKPAKGVDFLRYGVGRGVGPGPAYPIGWRNGTIPITWQSNDVDATLWGVQKVLWFVAPSYRGPVLVRGIGLDNAYRVRFDRGRIPPLELRLPRGTHERPSYVRILKPGCYAFQIDGLTFSRSIVFRAARSHY